MLSLTDISNPTSVPRDWTSNPRSRLVSSNRKKQNKSFSQSKSNIYRCRWTVPNNWCFVIQAVWPKSRNKSFLNLGSRSCGMWNKWQPPREECHWLCHETSSELENLKGISTIPHVPEAEKMWENQSPQVCWWEKTARVHIQGGTIVAKCQSTSWWQHVLSAQ